MVACLSEWVKAWMSSWVIEWVNDYIHNEMSDRSLKLIRYCTEMLDRSTNTPDKYVLDPTFSLRESFGDLRHSILIFKSNQGKSLGYK